MENLLLKYNANVGKDHLSEIEELTKKLSLNIVEVKEESPVGGKRIKVISISGSKEKIAKIENEMKRFASITVKRN